MMTILHMEQLKVKEIKHPVSSSQFKHKLTQNRMLSSLSRSPWFLGSTMRL